MSWCWNPSCVSTTKGMLLTVKTVHFYVTESVLCLFPYMKLLRRKGLLFYTIIRIWDKNNIAAKFLLFSRTMLNQQRILKQKFTIQKESISVMQFCRPPIRKKKITNLITPVNYESFIYRYNSPFLVIFQESQSFVAILPHNLICKWC